MISVNRRCLDYRDKGALKAVDENTRLEGLILQCHYGAEKIFEHTLGMLSPITAF